MFVYLAGPWPRREDIKSMKKLFEEEGFTIQARWLDFNGDGDSAEVQREEAMNDIEDIDTCNAVVVFNNFDTGKYKPGGMHFETGYAYAMGIPVILVGKPSNVFHHMPDMTVVDSVYEAIEEMHRMRSAALFQLRGDHALAE